MFEHSAMLSCVKKIAHTRTVRFNEEYDKKNDQNIIDYFSLNIFRSFSCITVQVKNALLFIENFSTLKSLHYT